VRTLNVRLFVILAAATVVCLVGFHFLHKYQVRRNAYVFAREAERAQQRMETAMKEKNLRAAQLASRDVVRNLSWYVRLAPDDVAAVERLGLLMADQADTSQAFARAFGMLERVVRQDPNRQEARRRLVDMAIMARRFQDAKEHLEAYLLVQSPDDASLWELLGRCHAETGDYEKAVDDFRKAIEFVPTLVDAYPRLAAVLRSRLSRPKEADQVMEKLVKVNPQSARAHVLRGNYLKSIDDSSDEALQEAIAAMALKPNDRDAMWLAAQCYLAKSDYAKARDFATRGIKLYPSAINLYTVLADIELRSGNRQQAIEALQAGLKATERSPQLLWSMANLLIDVKQLDDARGVIEELRATDYPRPLIEYLAARIDHVQGHWLAARQGFEKVRGMLTMWPSLLKQVDVWIGQCYGQLGNRDLQLEAYRRALNIDPFYGPARLGMTDVLMSTGNVDEAVREYSQLAKLGKLSSAGLIPMARMLILQNLRKPPDRRDWATVEKLLDQAEKASPEAAMIPVLRADVLVAQNRADEAEALIAKAYKNNPNQAGLWAVMASLAERRQDWKKAEEIIAEAEKSAGDAVEVRLARAQHFVRRHGRKAGPQLRQLLDNVDHFSDAQKTQLWSGLLNAAVQADDAELAKQLCRSVAEKDPNNVQVRYMLFEQCLRSNDQQGMEQALTEIQRVAGQGAYWLYGTAVLLSLQAETLKNENRQEEAFQALNQALRHLNQARELRQSWSRIPLLVAGIYDQAGKTELALKEYLEAIEMGERNPNAIRRAIQLLFQKQRYADADQLLRQLERQQIPFSSDLSRASAEIALRQGEFDRALEMAEQAALAQSKNHQEQVWLGQVLGIVGRRAKLEGKAKEADELLAKAEAALRRAVEIEPNIAATWVALIQFYSANNEQEKAEKVIEEAAKKIPEKQAPLALAQCCEAMKKTEAAQEKYEAALADAPQDPFVVRSVADFYCRTGKPLPAEALLRRIIDGKVKTEQPDVIWARRQLAIIYAARGGYQNLQKARQLIEDNLAAAESSVLDRRVKASLDAADPSRSRRDDAIAVLETMLQDQSATPEDRLELARMYLATGAWGKASTQLRGLVAAHPNEARYLATYISALLDHGETSNAEAYLARLEQSHPNHIIAVSLRAEVLVAKNDPDRAFELLVGFIDNDKAQPAERNLRLRLVAEKLEQISRRFSKPEQKAEKEKFLHRSEMLFRAYADQNAGQEWVLAAFLGRQQRIDEALDLLNRIWDSCNPTVLSQVSSLLLQSGQAKPEQLERLSDVLRKAEKQFNQPVPLMMAQAELSTRQAQYAKAEDLYREVLKKNSGNAAALNNLAVLLALQGIKLEESLEHINHAIELAGPVAAMLDSRASVYIAMGQPEKALADMSDALADAETPVRLFHQAQAFEQAGQRNAAAAAMEKALEKGLAKEMLQPLEYAAFEKLSQLPR